MMLGLASTIMTDPAMALGAGMAAGVAVTALAVRVLGRRRSASDPLQPLFERSTFEDQMESTAERSARCEPKGAVLKGRINHLAKVQPVWAQDTRAEAIAQVAQVMRAGVRKGDVVTDADAQGRFTIHAHGANEAEAGTIARRVLGALAETPIPAVQAGDRAKAAIEVSPDDWEEVRLLGAPPSEAGQSDTKAA